MTNVAVDIYAQVFVGTYILSSLEYILRSGIAGSCGNCVQHFEELLGCS